MKWLKIAITTTLAAALIGYVGPADILAALSQAAPATLAIACGLVALGFWLNAVGVRIFFRSRQGDRVESDTYYTQYFLSVLISFVSPGRIGDFSLALLLRQSVSPEHTTVYVFLDKLVTLMVLGAVGLCGLLYLELYTVAMSGVSMLVSILLITFFLFHKTWFRDSLAHRAPRVSRFITLASEEHLSLLRDHLWDILLNVLITVVRLFVVVGSLWFFLLAFGETAPFWLCFIALTCTQLIALIPISIQGIGVTEISYIVLLGGSGVLEASIVGFSIIGRVASILAVYLFYAYFRYRAGKQA